MSYEPTTWKAGDTVTSAKLNKMEWGIANNNNVIIETCEYDANELKFQSIRTIDEIIELCMNGKQVIFCFPAQDSWTWQTTEYYPIIAFRYDIDDEEGNEYGICIANSATNMCPSFGFSSGSYISNITTDSDTNLIQFDVYSAD